MASKIETKKIQPYNRGNKFGLVGHEYLMHQAIIPDDVTLEDALQPEYWQHVTQYFHQYDEIRLLAENGTWMARCLIVTHHSKFLKLKVLDQHDLEGESVKQVPLSNGGFTVVFKGPKMKYCVIRDSDSQIMDEGLKKEEAIKQRDEYAKNLSKVA